MYQIIFDANSAQWVVQLRHLGLFWRTIKSTPAGFADFKSAQAYVESVGLPEIYRDYHQSPTHQILAGYQPAVDTRYIVKPSSEGRMRIPVIYEWRDGVWWSRLITEAQWHPCK